MSIFYTFSHLRNKTRIFDKVKYKQKILFFYNLKIIKASGNKNLNIILLIYLEIREIVYLKCRKLNQL